MSTVVATSLRLLLVDDDPTVLALLRATLPLDRLEIAEAVDGRQALDLLAEGAPDLLILDWSMPEANGGDVLSAITARGLTLPVIILTAKTQPSLRTEATILGASSFLTKPFSPLQLLAEIERLLPGSAY